MYVVIKLQFLVLNGFEYILILCVVLILGWLSYHWATKRVPNGCTGEESEMARHLIFPKWLYK